MDPQTIKRIEEEIKKGCEAAAKETGHEFFPADITVEPMEKDGEFHLTFKVSSFKSSR